MIRYLTRRIIAAILTLLVVSILVFIAGRVTGSPLTHMLGDNATPAQYAALSAQLGLNKPEVVQYFIYLGQLVRGDFGTSITYQEPVISVIGAAMPYTLSLASVSFVFATVLGLALGIFSGSRRSRWQDKIVQSVALTGQAIPSFWLGIVLIELFAVRLRWLPAGGSQSWDSIVLPAFALGWYFLAAFLRYMRSSMLDVMGADYITMANARGLTRRSVVWKHAARNALLAPLTFMGVALGTLITGSLVIETVFAWPGLGLLSINAVLSADYPLLQSVVLVFTALYMAASLVVDLIYMVLDPRVRLFDTP
jgi:ABC-type dipeptide/oligopeptide/nickel transport system permease component